MDNYNNIIRNFSIDDFSSREFTRFLKHVVALRDVGKLDAFCTLYDIEMSEIAQLFEVASKFGNRSYNIEIGISKSIADAIRLFISKEPNIATI